MHEVRTGNKLRRIIEVVLVLGNYMNRAYGVYSQAQGFSVESLVKVGSRRSRKETLYNSSLLSASLQIRKPQSKSKDAQHTLYSTISSNIWKRLSQIFCNGRKRCPICEMDMSNLWMKLLDRYYIHSYIQSQHNITHLYQVSVLKEGLATVEGELKQQKPGNDPFLQVMTVTFPAPSSTCHILYLSLSFTFTNNRSFIMKQKNKMTNWTLKWTKLKNDSKTCARTSERITESRIQSPPSLNSPRFGL